MSIETDIEQIKKQEAALQFDSFTESDAWALGSLMRAEAEAKKLPLVIEIKMGKRPLFFTALPGTAEDNADWARRKANAVMKTNTSSYRLGLQDQAQGRNFAIHRGLDPADYVVAGGGFPIVLRNAGLLGTVTVSGIPQRQDHGFVVACLCKFLKLDHNKLALPEAE
jgi:uncharacterized protein (UPF0303 family)